MTDPITAEARPVAPARSGRLLLPLLATVAGAVIVGAFVGEVVFLWGALIGVVLAGGLWWARLGIDLVDTAILVAGSAVGLAYFYSVVDGRTGPIDKTESLQGAVGWLIVGIAFAYVLWRRDKGLGAPGAMIVALAWGVGGFVGLQSGTSVGFLDDLRGSQIEAGEVQEIGRSLFAWAGGFAAAIGAGVGLSYHVGSPALATIGGTGIFTIFASARIDFSIPELYRQMDRFGELAQEFWPPEWRWADFAGLPEELQILDPMIETMQIAVIGATVGCLVALPLAFFASRPTTYNGPVFWVSRTFLNVARTIPDLFWGIFFATAVGFGTPFAGALAMVMFSLSIMGKLFSETIDTIDPGPLEAARASGSRHSQVIQSTAMPQVLPNYVAYALYIFELNIRASVVIGLVGAGGIGLLLNEQRSFFQWDRVMAIVIVIFVAVIIIEAISVLIRKRLV